MKLFLILKSVRVAYFNLLRLTIHKQKKKAMFEDFNYITDENFLSNYWLEEKVVCHSCQGTGLIINEKNHLIICRVCLGKKMIKRSQEQIKCN
ncbi:MAG: hypothetical protein N5P05_003772 [Chroococcopsis gigantea SAG 12.99]|jgi:hypothetical protein|nr:hypothetical protein [Chroococcopsis gigantea SAG 12.99]